MVVADPPSLAVQDELNARLAGGQQCALAKQVEDAVVNVAFEDIACLQ